MKKLLAVVLAFCLAAAPAAFAEEDDTPIRVYLDGDRLTLTDADGNKVEPVIIDGVTYLPVRSVANALGLGVSWNERTRSVYLSSENDPDVIATDVSGFSNLEHYAGNPYELLGSSVFLNPLKELLGKDYDTLLLPMLSTCYAEGDGGMITLYGALKQNGVTGNTAAIDIYSSGRIDVALMAAVVDEDAKAENGKTAYRNVIKYYSSESPDAVDSPGLVSFIAQNVKSHGVIEFCRGKGLDKLSASTYSDVNGFGSFDFTVKDDGRYGFSGGITGSPLGGCTSSGTLNLIHGCTVCRENDAPSILFAFSGDMLTVIGLNNVTKPLTTVYKRSK